VTVAESLLVVVVAVVLLAWLGSRLLGAQQSWPRSLIAGLLGLVTGVPFAWLVTSSRNHQWPPPLVAGVGAVLMTMLAIAVMELLVPSGTIARVGLPRPIRAIRRRLARTRRYGQVTLIAARHGLGRHLGRGRGSLSAPAAASLGPALEEAGGIFIKLGQFLSTRPDLLPPALLAELSRLQDGVAPAPANEIRELLTRELGAPPGEVFARFDARPLAAASIGQAHRARLTSGEEVVVKVQRPAVEALVDRDIDILLELARTAEARSSVAREYHVLDMARGFARSLSEELDFRTEAQNIDAVRASLESDGGVVVPRVHPHLTTGRVLVMDWLDGVSVREAGATADRLELDGTALARNLLRCLVRQVMLDGVFHADPHPGNVLLLNDGRLALLDFGSVGRLNPLQVQALRMMMLAVQRRDPSLLRDAILDVTELPDGTDEEILERALADFMAQRLGVGMKPGAEMFTDLFRLLIDFHIAFPAPMAAVFRCLVTVEGTLALLAPGFQVVEEVRSVGTTWLLEAAAPDLRRSAQEELIAALPTLRRLPRRMDRVTAALERGRLAGNLRLSLNEHQERVFTHLVESAILAFLGAAVGLMSVLLLARPDRGPVMFAAASLYDVLGYAGLSVSAGLILRVLVGIARQRQR
jgi:ubiquinone biosynthesis protein